MEVDIVCVLCEVLERGGRVCVGSPTPRDTRIDSRIRDIARSQGMQVLLALAAPALLSSPHGIAASNSHSRASRYIVSSATYDSQRAVNIIAELASRASGLGAGGSEKQKLEVLELLKPYGDPALNVPEDVFSQIDQTCRELEARNPTPVSDCVAALEGAWQVRFSDAPPPSNGALGPLRGRAFQIVDVASRSYSNELALFGADGTRLTPAMRTPGRRLQSAGSAVGSDPSGTSPSGLEVMNALDGNLKVLTT